MLGVLGGFLGTEKGKVEKKICPFRLESIIVTVVQIRKKKIGPQKKKEVSHMLSSLCYLFIVVGTLFFLKNNNFRAIVKGQRRKGHKSTISHGELTMLVSPTDCFFSNLTIEVPACLWAMVTTNCYMLTPFDWRHFLYIYYLYLGFGPFLLLLFFPFGVFWGDWDSLS